MYLGDDMGFFNIFKKNDSILNNRIQEQAIINTNDSEKIQEQVKKNLIVDDTKQYNYLEKILNNLKNIGYGEEKLSIFREEGKKIIEKNSNNAEMYLDGFYNQKEEEMNNARNKLERTLSYYSESLEYSKEEKEQKMKEANDTFNAFCGNPFNISDKMEKMLNKLTDLGYGILKIDEFRAEMQNIVALGKAKSMTNEKIVNDLNNYVYVQENKIQILRENLEEKLANPENFKYKDLLIDKFNLSVGHPFDIKKEIDREIEKLRSAGYGVSKLNEFREEINIEVEKAKEENKDNSIIKNIINDYFSKKLEIIREYTTRKNERIRYINNSKKNDENDQNFMRLYGNSIINKRKHFEAKIVNLEYLIKCGNDKYEELKDCYKEYLSTFGYDKQSCNEILDGKEMDINETNKIVMYAKEQNQKLLNRLLKNKVQLTGISNIYYQNENKDNLNLFMKKILSTYGASRKELRESISNKLAEILNQNTQKSALGEIADITNISDFAKDRMHMYDDIDCELSNINNKELAEMLAEHYTSESINDDIERKMN